jgi:anti-sigma regulatory factor (Ser/Thr protein kinase)
MNNLSIKVLDMHKYKIDKLSNMKPIINQMTDDLKTQHPLSEEKHFDVRLVLSELIMNAFMHSKEDALVDVLMDSEYSDGKIKITVEDYGHGFDAEIVDASREFADIYDNSGRGITLVKALCDKVTYNDAGNRVSIVMSV